MGVKRAIELALEASRHYRLPIYTFGPLIHNAHVLEMLQKKGIHQVQDISDVSDGILLVRAHGISPAERERMEQRGLIIIDGTCPRVKRIHLQIRKYLEKDYDIIVFGDAEHAEVTGLLGTAGTRGRLVSSSADLADFKPCSRPILLVSQTTQSRQAFDEIREIVQQRCSSLVVIDTLCSTTEERQAEVIQLAAANDAVVVVGGKTSANTARLSELARLAGKTSYHVESEEDLPASFPDDIRRIAVTAGASTPNWMIERVIERLESIDRPRTLKTVVLEAVKWLTESFALVALGSACLTMTCSFLLFQAIELIPVIVASSYVLSMHILNHFADRKSVAINEPLREEVFQRHKNAFISLGIVSGGIALMLSVFLGKWAVLMVFFGVVTGAVYSLRIVPRRLTWLVRYQRLKEIPASKDVVVGLAWSSVTVFVPYFGRHGYEDHIPHLLLVWLIAFFLVYIRAVLLDIKDIQGDRIVGKETLALILGEKRALKLISVLLTIVTGLLVFGAVTGLLPKAALFQILALAPLVLVILGHSKRQLKRRYRFQALLDIGFICSGVITLFSLI